VSFSLIDGTPLAVGVLKMINHSSTTVTVLDDEVPLDRRAAVSIMEYRHGADGLPGTDDDNGYDNTVELDSRYWVGPRAGELLGLYADATGWVPQGEDYLATWEGVPFTVEQAEEVLALVNSADVHTLDVGVDLDRRAVDSIMAERPFQSITQVAELYWVGPAALIALSEYAWGEVEIDDGCEPSLVAVSNDDASDYTRLLELSTTVDAPWAEVYAYEIVGCSKWQNSADGLEMLTEALWNESFHITWDELEGMDRIREPGELTDGGATWNSIMQTSLVVIDERVEDGDFDPNQGGEATDLYDRRDELVDALTEGLDTAPTDHMELPLYMDMIECSEESSALIDTRTNTVLLVHQFARC
jgi:hypothetical protein